MLRTALALASVTKTPLELANVRSTRPKPGLQAQHLTAIKAFELLGAKVKGAELGSQSIEFRPPDEINEKEIELDVGTAGSTTLVMQSLFLPLCLAEKSITVKIKGGTHVKWAPTTDYFSQVFLPAAARMGLHAFLEVERHGFYPVGGGIAVLKTKPSKSAKGLEISDKGKLVSLEGISAASLPIEVAERQKTSAMKILFDYSPKISVEQWNADCPGTSFFLKAQYENSVAGFTSLGEKGKPAETVGKEAANSFLDFNSSNETVDEHLADQLLALACVAKGKTRFNAKPTAHLLSNASVCRTMTNREIEIEENGREALVTVLP